MKRGKQPSEKSSSFLRVSLRGKTSDKIGMVWSFILVPKHTGSNSNNQLIWLGTLVESIMLIEVQVPVSSLNISHSSLFKKFLGIFMSHFLCAQNALVLLVHLI